MRVTTLVSVLFVHQLAINSPAASRLGSGVSRHTSCMATKAATVAAEASTRLCPMASMPEFDRVAAPSQLPMNPSVVMKPLTLSTEPDSAATAPRPPVRAPPFSSKWLSSLYGNSPWPIDASTGVL